MNFIDKIISETLAPPPKLLVSEWADRYRQLSSETSAEKGAWNSLRAPYQIGIMNAFNDPKVWKVVGMLPAQTGKSEVLNNITGYYITNDPSPILFVQPTLADAEKYSKDRIASMVRDCQVLKDVLGESKSKTSTNTILHKNFAGGNLTIAGANSASNLASMPKRIVLLDEIDRYPESVGSEGDPCAIAEARTTNFYNRKIGMFSTPTNKDASRIEKAYEEGDKRKYFVPCPECNQMQVLMFDHLKFEHRETELIPGTVFYECANCGHKIHESKKTQMLLKGEWRAEKQFFGIASFWLNALYSPWYRWEDLAREFLRKKNDPMQLKVFVNTRLAETWEERGESPEWERIYMKRSNYARGTIPKGGVILVAGADVQHDRIEVEIVAFARDKVSYSVDYRVFLGSPLQKEVWKDLDNLLNEKFPHMTGGEMTIMKLAIDSGDGQTTSAVYEWARRHGPKRVMPVKGSSIKTSQIISPPKPIDININGQKIPKGIHIWIVGTHILKGELYSLLRIDGQCHFPDYPESYFKMLVSEEVRKFKTRSGVYKFDYVLPHGRRNEALDCRVYARACAEAIGISRFTSQQWDRMEAMLTRKKEEPVVRAPLKRQVGRAVV